jgi:hypothetical protein
MSGSEVEFAHDGTFQLPCELRYLGQETNNHGNKLQETTTTTTTTATFSLLVLPPGCVGFSPISELKRGCFPVIDHIHLQPSIKYTLATAP